MVSYHSCLQATFGRGAWAGDGRLEMNHQSVLTPDNSGPVLRWASFTTAHHKHNQNSGSVCTAHCLQMVCQSADWLQSTLVSTDTSKEQALFAGQQLGSAAVMVACTKQQAASLTFFLLCPCTLCLWHCGSLHVDNYSCYYAGQRRQTPLQISGCIAVSPRQRQSAVPQNQISETATALSSA